MIRIVLAMLLVACPAAGRCEPYHPAFRPQSLKGPPTGRPNQVLVLGTPHLSGLPATFRPSMLAPLIDRLAAWRPQAIATEDLSGLQCDALRRYPERYAATITDYCWDQTPATRATGLDVPAATAEAERLLAALPPAPAPAARRRLAAVFLAAGERGSALVQWLRLPAAERHAGDGLDDRLTAILVAYADRRNETGLVAAALAARLGLDRLWSVDDHSADTPDSPDPAVAAAAAAAIGKAWDNPATRARAAEDKRLAAGLSSPGGMMALYRAYNRPENAIRAYRSDFGAALAEPSPQAFGRRYVGYWETRNLRMVANIRDILGQHPGTRLLAIVGASHKGYYEAYLDMMHDVTLVDAEAVLR